MRQMVGLQKAGSTAAMPAFAGQSVASLASQAVGSPSRNSADKKQGEVLRRLTVCVAAAMAVSWTQRNPWKWLRRPASKHPWSRVQRSEGSRDWQPTVLINEINKRPVATLAHKNVTFRNRADAMMDIPQAERYTSKDWFRTLMNWPYSGILQRIAHPVCWITVWSIAMVALDFLLPSGLPVLSSRGHVLLGPALSLLLVFRTNAAYSRFQGGRKVWEQITSVSRNTARLVAACSEAFGNAKTHRLAALLCAFPFLVQEHVQGRHRKPHRLDELIQEMTGGNGIAGLEMAQNRPLHVLDLMIREIKTTEAQPEKMYEARDRVNLYTHIGRLADTVSKCECLVQTPVPLNYARHTSRFLTMFMLTLPFVLIADYGVLSIPVMAFTSWVFFGIQEIGLWIEEPFREVLKLGVICNAIGADVVGTIYVSAFMPERFGGQSNADPHTKLAVAEYGRLLCLFQPWRAQEHSQRQL
mmetsp:Transcript_3927/g.9131  ORF Transcript_3927/g.9131 Transcript_3927/m.9131 type:complete len:470 (-) Transcript_3927:338-1747(-)